MIIVMIITVRRSRPRITAEFAQEAAHCCPMDGVTTKAISLALTSFYLTKKKPLMPRTEIHRLKYLNITGLSAVRWLKDITRSLIKTEPLKHPQKQSTMFCNAVTIISKFGGSSTIIRYRRCVATSIRALSHQHHWSFSRGNSCLNLISALVSPHYPRNIFRPA